MKLEKIIRNYENSCNEIVGKFCKKQDIELDFWVGDEIGGIASFCCQYFFNIEEILLDLKTNQPKWLILEWQDYVTDYNVTKGNEQPLYINYASYIKGARYENKDSDV